MKDKEKELGEKIFIMGSEDDELKAARLCLEISEDQERYRAEWKDRWHGILEDRRYKKMEYNLALRTLLLSLVRSIDFPKGYKVEVLATDEGVILKMMTDTGRIFAQGIEATGEIKYDFNAMITVSIRLENTLDRLTGADRDKSQGLVMPGSADFNDYGRGKL